MTALPPRCAGCNCDAPAVTDPQFAVVAHGQPGNPGVLQPELEALAARVTSQLGAPVAGATLACPRSLAALRGVRAIYPLFMAGGWFVNSEMPRRLTAAGVEGYAVLPPLGFDPALPALGADLARAAAATAGLDPADTTLVVVGHGSSKSSASADATRAFAAALPPGFARVLTVFLEEPPHLADVAPDGPAVCLPFFATNGSHTTDDIPADWRDRGPLTPAIGTTDAIPALIAAALGRA